MAETNAQQAECLLRLLEKGQIRRSEAETKALLLLPGLLSDVASAAESVDYLREDLAKVIGVNTELRQRMEECKRG